MKQEIIDETLSVTSNFMYKKGWGGACYATSAIHHILLNEQGINNKPMLGVTKVGESIFDHAWVEIDTLIYDIAISNPQENTDYFFEIFGKDGIRGDIESQCSYSILGDIEIIYGGFGVKVDDDIIKVLKDFGTYMSNNHPFFNGDIDYWDLTIEFGKQLKLSLNKEDLIEKYSKIKWNLV